GITWTDLGVLNDPNGINWYDESLYEHAALDPANWDDGTAQTYGVGNASNPAASWTSNDNGTTGSPGNQLPVGPSGWVYVQLKITTTSHPTAARSPNIRFRYVAFSDGSLAFGGWAFDNFALSATPPVFAGGTIMGHAWNDANGNGVDDGEADITATKVYVSLLGSLIDSVLTSGTGDYSWSGVTLPAAYEIKLNVAGVAFTVPFGISNAVNVNHLADSSTKTQDFGTFAGSVSGKKFSDVNDNGVNDSEPGVAGWTIQIHRDSLTGLLMGSDVSDGSGDYSLLLPAYAGSYVANEVAQPLVGRRTFPAGAGTHTFSVNVGTPNVTGKDFGNFLYGRIRVQLTVDQNGNGVRDAGDIIAVPSGSTSSFNVKQNGAHLPGSPFTLGGGSIGSTFTGLDTGTYVVSEVDSIPGWRRTKGGVDSVVVSTSGLNDTSDYLDFKYLVITGNKFNDLDGDGVKDGGEPGLEGWTINVTGGVYYGGASAATDTNGDYSIDSVFTGSHVVSEVVQAGWTRTMPGGAGTYAIAGISGNLINTTGKDFGNFDNSDVSGIVYRDYNGNGVMDGSDAAMSGVTVDLAVNGGSDVSDGSGYSFNGVIAVDTVRITVPGGFTISQPAAGEYPVALISGGAATLRHFGLFQTTDSSTKYRTFTAAQLGADDQKKPGKRPKAGKAYDPVKNKPNSANLVDDLIGKTGQAIGSIRVGLAGQLNVAGKTKAYVQPNKQSALWGSLNNKSLHHTGMARGFDLDIKGKPFLKLQKSFGPNKKQNNKLFGELLALKLNLVASGLKTPAGLGVLIYSDPLSDYDGMTVDEIADTADVVMTNYEFVPLGVYAGLDTVVAKINAAFYNAATDDTSAGWAAPKLQWRAYTSVDEVSYLKPNPGATPKNRRVETVEAVPTAFALEQNYPNPFNPTTTIEFDLPEASIVTLKVYNLLGQEVATLFDREEIELNETVEFDASSLPSGVYLYRIVAETIADAEEGVASETFTQVKKMVLVK
ncbi:MAG TPA: T9SS type A sorting domain-containing protein, partial [Bacteroidota bacterium]|nr:T9SS type A sorting domain-containing protein [Bacteroidota bacterium]